MFLVCLFFFFFSSRRRHTRSLRDWSSDVCSSDLTSSIVRGSTLARTALWPASPTSIHGRCWTSTPPPSLAASPRSEERRVGKECRPRVSRERYKREETKHRVYRVSLRKTTHQRRH